MRRTFTILSVVFLISAATLSAQSNAVYAIRNNASGTLLSISSLVEGENDNVYCIGFDNLMSDYFLTKLNDNGQLVWQKKLTSTFWGLTSIHQLAFYNNEIYFIGTVYDIQTKYMLVKADINGNLMWSKLLTPVGLSVYHMPSLSVKQNSGITVAGSMSESIDIFSLTTDGVTNWIKNFTTDTFAYKNPNFDITVTDNGDIVGCAKAESDMSFYCMGSDGNMKWASRVLEMNTNYTHVKSIVEVSANKFLVCGFRNVGGFYGFIDSTGSFTSLTLVNEFSQIRTGMVLNDGNILLEADHLDGHVNYLLIDDQGSLVNNYSSPFSISTYTSFNGLAETSNAKYFADAATIKKVADFNSLECLNLIQQPITFTGQDPSASPSANYFAMHAPGSIANYPDAQLTISSLELEVACSIVSVDETNSGSIDIFPTALNNNESIFVKHTLENTVLDYQILDLNGKIVSLNPLKDNSIAINGLSAGMYVIQFAVKGSVIHSDKFVVVN